MSQFTVYLNEDDSSKDTYPYFIDIQNSLLDDLNSRLVIPLSKQSTLNNISAKTLSLSENFPLVYNVVLRLFCAFFNSLLFIIFPLQF